VIFLPPRSRYPIHGPGQTLSPQGDWPGPQHFGGGATAQHNMRNLVELTALFSRVPMGDSKGNK